MSRLLAANIALAALLAVHVADHVLRQPADEQLSLVSSLPGLLGTVAVFLSLVLVARGTRHGPQIAGALGLLTAAGFVAVHIAPYWSMFSDPYADRYLDAGSWIQMLAGLVGGLWLAYEGRSASRAAAGDGLVDASASSARFPGARSAPDGPRCPPPCHQHEGGHRRPSDPAGHPAIPRRTSGRVH